MHVCFNKTITTATTTSPLFLLIPNPWIYRHHFGKSIPGSLKSAVFAPSITVTSTQEVEAWGAFIGNVRCRNAIQLLTPPTMKICLQCLLLTPSCRFTESVWALGWTTNITMRYTNDTHTFSLMRSWKYKTWIWSNSEGRTLRRVDHSVCRDSDNSLETSSMLQSFTKAFDSRTVQGQYQGDARNRKWKLNSATIITTYRTARQLQQVKTNYRRYRFWVGDKEGHPIYLSVNCTVQKKKVVVSTSNSAGRPKKSNKGAWNYPTFDPATLPRGRNRTETMDVRLLCLSLPGSHRW